MRCCFWILIPNRKKACVLMYSKTPFIQQSARNKLFFDSLYDDENVISNKYFIREEGL